MRLDSFLSESNIVNKVKVNIKNIQMLHDKMKELSKGNNYAWTVTVVFGLAYITAWKNPSVMLYTVIGDTPLGFINASGKKGFYQNGEFKEFSPRLYTEYQKHDIQD